MAEKVRIMWWAWSICAKIVECNTSLNHGGTICTRCQFWRCSMAVGIFHILPSWMAESCHGFVQSRCQGPCTASYGLAGLEIAPEQE